MAGYYSTRFVASSVVFGTAGWVSPWLRVHCEHDQQEERAKKIATTTVDATGKKKRLPSRVIFLGSGSSTGLPRPWCLTNPDDDSRSCIINRMAAIGDPADNRNYRGNPSLLISYVSENGEGSPTERNIHIDVGKTFRENVIRWYPRHNILSLDAIIFSHDHADAILGLDDVRGLQGGDSQAPQSRATPVFMDEKTHSTLKKVFPYLCKEGGGVFGIRHVASLTFKQIQPMMPFNCVGLDVLPVSVKHGEDYDSLGFVFGTDEEKGRVVYISDVSRIPPQTMTELQREKIQLLVVDALLMERKHATHFSALDAIELAKTLKPAKTLLVGMSSDFEHHSYNAKLAKLKQQEGVDIQLSYDGLAVEVYL